MKNEKRLIDANALKRMFDEREADDTELYGGCYIVECFPADDAKEIVDKMPTVDAVEVVRCKDCKHRGTDYCIFHIKGEPADEELLKKLDNDFCSYGERKVVTK